MQQNMLEKLLYLAALLICIYLGVDYSGIYNLKLQTMKKVLVLCMMLIASAEIFAQVEPLWIQDTSFVKELYDTYLEKPGSHKAHKILHTTYVKRKVY